MMTVANWLAGTLSGTLPPAALAEWGISYRTVNEGDLARLVTGTFLSHDLDMFLGQFVFAAVVIGYFEWHRSTLLAVLTYFFIDTVGTLIVLFGVVPFVASVSALGHPAAHQTLDVGMSAGGFGLIGAILAGWPRKWLLLAGLLAAIGLKVWFSFEVIADSAHVICLLIGFALQQMIAAQDQSAQREKPSEMS
ncbi:MAG: hypothetical protein WBB25_00820 [Sulfitobacter sp.]